MKDLLKFLEEHEALLSVIPGFVEGLYDYVGRLMNRGGTDEEKRAQIEALAVDLRARAEKYRTNPPELPA